ncbi:hypothetical protein [Pseudonocardia abyssalis]|uniref:Uncharacterized protein n=1 Tax=Pseudonocardia abyssalis TaxID=2792008 RepID=A0ABS6UZU2_9PSEU|nr:hypothetical protein [Pseudonocardia abyssalis]MBW0114816.1 hypothetical protein [Pseudonocardia abyssalis]MBW0137219.1 hypothetical protein [Pseudonocardia abyssalis]
MSEVLSDDPVVAAPVGRVLAFGPGEPAAVRRFTRDCAAVAGLAPERIDDMVMAVNEAATNEAATNEAATNEAATNEAATNAIEHGGGRNSPRTAID